MDAMEKTYIIRDSLGDFDGLEVELLSSRVVVFHGVGIGDQAKSEHH